MQSFNVADALADPSHAPELQPLDTSNSSAATILKIRPMFPCGAMCAFPEPIAPSGDIHLSDAIHLAGGLSPDAATGDAQVFRYQPDSSLKILNVKLSGALDGSPSDDIVLHSRDRVLIHKNAAAS